VNYGNCGACVNGKGSARAAVPPSAGAPPLRRACAAR